MKRIIICMSLMVLLVSQNATAACDWSTGIKELPNGNYSYSRECHGEVGVIGKALKSTREALEARKEESEALRAEVTELSTANTKVKKSLELKDLALDRADTIALKWRDETYNQHERLLRQEKLAQSKSWLYFGGGIGLTILSVWAAGQISR